jgi:hypothetical protein
MQIREDERQFDRLQLQVLRAIAEAIKRDLQQADLDEDWIRELTGDITFAVAAIIDGSHVIELDGRQVRPVLAFSEDEECTRLVTVQGGSWMHEYAFGVVDSLFDAEE